MDYITAIMFILPQAKWKFSQETIPEGGWKYEHIIWEDLFYPKPTELMLQEAYYNSVRASEIGYDYRLQRAEHYPTAEQQLAIIFDVGIDGWCKYIQGVKDKFPKPQREN
jgi:hypothetical protein